MNKMDILKDNKIVDVNEKIRLEMTVGDFLSMYIAKMTCLPHEFESCQKQFFPEVDEDLYLESVDTSEMEWIIDEIRFPHKEWL